MTSKRMAEMWIWSWEGSREKEEFPNSPNLPLEQVDTLVDHHVKVQLEKQQERKKDHIQVGSIGLSWIQNKFDAFWLSGWISEWMSE